MYFNFDPELIEDIDEGENADAGDLIAASQGVGSKRGPKKIAEQWTRVISLRSDNLNDIQNFSVASELLMA